MPVKILVSAGEASGDLYTARLVDALRGRLPDAEFFGCAGPRMRKSGVRAVVDTSSLAVVGLVEVAGHLPRIYGEYRRLIRAAKQERPRFAVLTDSPDFHLRVAASLRRLGIPVLYLVAPQAWAWRKGRVRSLRRNISRLLCIFPFEEEFFRRHGVPATYIGHPLTRLVRPSLSKEDFFRKHRLPAERPMVAVLPGSRRGEIERHLPYLVEAVDRLYAMQARTFVLATPPAALSGLPASFFRERIGRSPIQVVEGETWDVLAHTNLAMAASGTVTIEAALLGAPMVTFYRVSGLTWWLGRRLVEAPHFSMVNLVAGRRIVPELIQDDMTGERLSEEATRLLDDPQACEPMREGLREVARRLSSEEDPMERAAREILESVGEVSGDAP